MMKQEKKFNKKDAPMMSFLEDAGFDFNRTDHTHYKLKSAGFMNLTVESWIEPTNAGNIKKISVCHYGEQNGDAMRDPEIVYRLDGITGIEIPEYFRNDYVGLEQEVYPVIEGKQMINPKLLQQLKEFSRTWSRNLIDQGFNKAVEQNS